LLAINWGRLYEFPGEQYEIAICFVTENLPYFHQALINFNFNVYFPLILYVCRGKVKLSGGRKNGRI